MEEAVGDERPDKPDLSCGGEPEGLLEPVPGRRAKTSGTKDAATGDSSHVRTLVPGLS